MTSQVCFMSYYINQFLLEQTLQFRVMINLTIRMREELYIKLWKCFWRQRFPLKLGVVRVYFISDPYNIPILIIYRKMQNDTTKKQLLFYDICKLLALLKTKIRTYYQRMRVLHSLDTLSQSTERAN